MQPLQSSICHIKIFNTSAKFTHILRILFFFSANLAQALHAVIYSDRRARQSAIHYNCCLHTHKHHQNITLFEPLNTQSLASRSSISSPYRRATQDLKSLPGTLLPTLQRLVQRSTNISPAPSLGQKPKSSHNNPHQQSKPSNACFLSPQQQAQELEPATKRQQYSTCSQLQLFNQMDIKHADR